MKQASKGLASERCTPTQGECEEEEGGRAERALEGVLRFWVFGVLAGCVEPGTASCWSGWIQEDGRRSLGDTIPDTRATSKVRRGSFAEPFGAHCQTQEREGERATRCAAKLLSLVQQLSMRSEVIILYHGNGTASKFATVHASTALRRHPSGHATLPSCQKGV